MTLLKLFALYEKSHHHPINQRIHHLAVPAIYFSVLGMLWCIPPLLFLNWAFVALLPTLIYFFRLSRSLAIGMLASSVSFLAVCAYLGPRGFPVLGVSIATFVFGWILQFIGHAIEGARPSFAEDVQFLLVGPLWVLAHIYQRLGIKLANLPKKTS